MKVSVLGLGWYGGPLALALTSEGFEVTGSTRSPDKLIKFQQQGAARAYLLESPHSPNEDLLSSDVLVLNIPPKAGQLEWFRSWHFKKDPWVIFISSTSLAPLLLEEESWIMDCFKDWTILRFAGLIGGQRHPGRSLSGKKDLKGRLWPVNLLHQDDAVGFTLEIIRQKIKGEIIEVLSDEHHTREEFYTEFAKRSGTPVPQFDQGDLSLRSALENSRAKSIYSFKWPKMIGRSL